MSKYLEINKKPNEAIIDFFSFLIDNNKVKGVFTLKKISKDGDVAYSLITNKDDLKDAVPFYPLMPVNSGRLLSRFTIISESKEPIIVFLKPCELRAFFELIKLEQGYLNNIILMSATCGGAYPLQMSLDDYIDKNLSEYWRKLREGKVIDKLRSVCKSCEEFIPYNSDITVDLVGNKNIDKKVKLFINTKKAEEIVSGFSEKLLDGDLDKNKLKDIKDERTKIKKKLYDELNKKMKGIDGLVNIFGKCISCHGCSRVCPVCYCKLCEFESQDCEYTPSNYESELKDKDGVRVPPGTIFYHLGRLNHIGISCVACGACSDVCPVDIPISMIFKKVGESIQELFDYIPGKNVEDKIPLTTFKKEEFAEIEE